MCVILVPTKPPTVTPPTQHSVCKGVDPTNCPSSCADGLVCDGTKCVPPSECPCVLPDGQYLSVSLEFYCFRFFICFSLQNYF